jgi:uncharacterized repeat protein (TIGR01451 family)
MGAAGPVRFHVASSNSPNIPKQIDDNMAGPGGLVGSTRIAGVTILPKDITRTVVPAGDSWLPHTITNTGLSPDIFNLDWTSSGDFTPSAVSVYHDAEGDGRLDPADPLLSDTDGDGRPDTGPLAVSGLLDILVVVSAPAGVSDGQTALVSITASSSPSPAVADTTNDTVTVAIPAVTLVKSVDKPSAEPGEILTYTVTYNSTGSTDARQVVLADEVPSPTVYLAGSATGTGAVIEFSHDGGLTFDSSEAAPVTHIRWSLSSPLSPGDSGQVSFQSSVP